MGDVRDILMGGGEKVFSQKVPRLHPLVLLIRTAWK
jgi:hypothetical protein